MIAPNSLFRQTVGDHGEEEEETGSQRKGGTTGTPTPGADAPTGLILSAVSNVRNRRKHALFLCAL